MGSQLVLNVPGETLAKVDNYVWHQLWNWIARRHPGKSQTWRKRKYFSAAGDKGRVSVHHIPGTGKAAGQFDIVELNENEIVESYSGYRLITNHDIKLPVEQFAVRGDLGWISPAESKRLKLSEGKTSIPTPLGSKEFRLILLTDSTKTPPEKMKAKFVVFQDGRPKCQFEFNGFKNLDADWIDEKALQIVYWPGTRVRAIELINVETGKIIYKSASGIYDHLESPSARSKKPRRNKKLFQHFIFRATPHNPEWHNYIRSKSDLYGRVI